MKARPPNICRSVTVSPRGSTALSRSARSSVTLAPPLAGAGRRRVLLGLAGLGGGWLVGLGGGEDEFGDGVEGDGGGVDEEVVEGGVGGVAPFGARPDPNR